VEVLLLKGVRMDKELELLAKEARKYKSPEEFTKYRYSLPLYSVDTIRKMKQILQRKENERKLLKKIWKLKKLPEPTKWDKNLIQDFKLFKKANFTSINDFWNFVKKSKKLRGVEYAWDKNRWRPILEKRRIERGKHKGKFKVVFPDKKERIVDKIRNIGGLNMDRKNLLFLALFSGLVGYGWYIRNIWYHKEMTRRTMPPPISGVSDYSDLLTTGIGIGGRPRFGRPKTDEERKLTHHLRYGTTDLPPRGTGLLRRGLVY